jgi:OPA family glycerol-3-phosphate transporter-like MFS transporter/OPA family sugar phosphate sensor protein UhpC-like MFS transporter
VRKNLSVAMPVMEQQLGISKAQLGLFLTLHGLLYGVSKFVNGMIGDRVSAPLFMSFT